MDEQEVAEAVGRGMFEADRASRRMGMELVAIRPGYARMRMAVREDMLNGHAICHGGLIFSLADSTFAFACNARNETTVASGCQITFVAPARLGETLVAEGTERTRTGRTGVYDVEVRKEDGTLIALFRGHSYRVSGRVVDLAPPAGDHPETAGRP